MSTQKHLVKKTKTYFVSKETIQLKDNAELLEDKLKNALGINQLVSYLVASHLPYTDKTGKYSYDKDSYGALHDTEVLIDTNDSESLLGYKKLIDYLYGFYNNDWKKVQPKLNFKNVNIQERKKLMPFGLPKENLTKEVKYQTYLPKKSKIENITDKNNTVVIFAAASLKHPISKKVGRILGQKGQSIIIGGPGVTPENIMINSARTAKKYGSKVGFISTKFIFKKQGSLRIKPDFVLIAKTMQNRHKLMYDLSSLILALPGGIATVEEIFSAIGHNLINQISGGHKKPILLANQSGFWNPFYDWLKVLHLDDQVTLLPDIKQLAKYFK